MPGNPDRKVAVTENTKHVAAQLDQKLNEAPMMVPLEDAITQLADQGLSAEFIANALSMPNEKVVAILSIRRRVLSPEDSHIADGMRSLIRKAQKEAMYILEWGPTEQKLGLVKVLLGQGGRLIGAETGDVEEELKSKVNEMFQQMRSGAIDAKVVVDNDNA